MPGQGEKTCPGISGKSRNYGIRLSNGNTLNIYPGSSGEGTITAKIKGDDYANIGGNEGETVTLTISPDSGYTLAGVGVKDEGGNDVTVTDNSFVMPSGNVTVTAKFTAPPVKEPTASAQLVNDYAGTYDVASLWQFTVTSGTNAVESLGAKINGAATDTLSVGQITDATIVFGVVVDIQSKDITSKAAVVNGDEITVE